MELDKVKLTELLKKYPKLRVILYSGVVSFKLTCNVLDIDRDILGTLYQQLIECGAVRGVSSGTFRGTEAAMQFLKEEYDNGY